MKTPTTLLTRSIAVAHIDKAIASGSTPAGQTQYMICIFWLSNAFGYSAESLMAQSLQDLRDYFAEYPIAEDN